MPVPDLGAGNTTENALAAGLIDEQTARHLLSMPRSQRTDAEMQMGLRTGGSGFFSSGIGGALKSAAPIAAGIIGGPLAGAAVGAGIGLADGGGASGALKGGAGGALAGGAGSSLGGSGKFGSTFRSLVGGEEGGFRDSLGGFIGDQLGSFGGGEEGGFRDSLGGFIGDQLGSFGGAARDMIGNIDPMQAAMLPFAIKEARQAGKDREFARDLAHQGIDHFGQAADIAMGDWEQRAPMREEFISGAMGFHDPHNPFATDPMAGMGGPQQPAPQQQQMPEIQGPPSLDHLAQNPGFMFGGGGGGGGGHPAPVSGGFPAPEPQFGPHEIPVDQLHQRII